MSPNDPSRVREEKASLYQSAVEAWEKGEVTVALGKLEQLAALDRDFPDAAAGSGSTYRNFYNQVHSESDAIRKAYEDAKGQFAAGNLDSAMSLCRQYLAKYPNHAPFKALKSEIESRQRSHSPLLAQAIVETERKVEDEPDLDRRVAILEAALTQFPGDPHFQSSLQSVKDLRDVVNSIISKARLFEGQKQFAEALDQWQILRSIHPKQPGLTGEIQRLSSVPEPAPPKPEPARPRSEWADHARKYLEAGDYQRAVQALAIGLAESPNDPDLRSLDQQVRQGQDRANRALELLGTAHEAINKGAMESGLATLREAFVLDPRNSVIKTVLVNGLLEQAKRRMDSDPAASEGLVQEVLRMEPGNAQATILAQGIADRRRSIAAPVPPAGSMRDEPTLAIPPSVAQALNAPPPVQAQPVAVPPPPAPAAVPVKPAAAKPPAAAPPKPPAGPPPPPGYPKKLLLGTAAAAGLLLIIALAVNFARHRAKPAPAPAAKYTVSLRSTPENAEIKVNGETCGISTCSRDLAPGNYQVQAQLTGYQSANIAISVGPGSPKEFNITLSPQGPRAAIFTDLAEGTVSLDDAPAGQIQGGGAEVPNLTPGKHVLAVKGADSTASIPVEISAGAEPALAGPIDAKNARCFVVAAYGGNAHVYGSGTGYRVTLDGKPLGPLAAAGIPLQGLTPGSHEMVVDSDAGQHDRMVFESQPSATLYVSVGTAQNLGTLSIETNEDQVHVLINGQKYKRDTVRGHLVVSLFPKKYTVTVQKDGFGPPVEQTVEVKRGQDTKVSFALSPAKSILAVHHAPPGSDVLVDNISRGTVHPDGEFQVGGIDPGRHIVILHHDGFKPLQSNEIFLAGKTVDLQAAMDAVPTTGTVRFEISPAGLETHIRVKRDGEAQEHDVTGTTATLPEGHYVVSVSAPQYQTGTAAIQVTAGGTAVASVTLRRAEPVKAAPKGPTVVFGLEDWLKTPGWSQQNGMIVHKGGDWAMATPDISEGTIRFVVVSIKGRHVEWGVACRDEKNFIHYELDDKNISRYELRNGTKLGQVKVAHGLDKKKPMGISLSVTPQSVVLSVNRGGWVDIDKWDVEGSSVHGRFGFRIPGSDEIGLQEFQIAR